MTDPTKNVASAEEVNPFVSLKNILEDEKFSHITLAELVTAIEVHGICAYDAFERLLNYTVDSEQSQEVMKLLREFKFHDPNYNEDHGIPEYDPPLLDDIINENFGKYPSEPQTYPSRYNYYGWLKSDLPATLSIAPNQSEANTANQEPVKVSKPTFMNESTHDPLGLTVIANMFLIDPVPYNNLKSWRKFAKDANRNGLIEARTSTGKGRAQSLFDPVKVGDWLVKERGFTLEKVERILNNNLPKRSSHLKDTHY